MLAGGITVVGGLFLRAGAELYGNYGGRGAAKRAKTIATVGNLGIIVGTGLALWPIVREKVSGFLPQGTAGLMASAPYEAGGTVDTIDAVPVIDAAA